MRLAAQNMALLGQKWRLQAAVQAAAACIFCKTQTKLPASRSLAEPPLSPQPQCGATGVFAARVTHCHGSPVSAVRRPPMAFRRRQESTSMDHRCPRLNPRLDRLTP